MPVTNPKEPKPSPSTSPSSVSWQIPTLVIFLTVMALMHLVAAFVVAPAFLLAATFETLLVFGVWQRARSAWVILAVVGVLQTVVLTYISVSGQLASIGMLFTLAVQVVFLAVLALAFPVFFPKDDPSPRRSFAA